MDNEIRNEDVINLVLDRLKQEGLYFATKDDQGYASAKNLYKLDKEGLLEEKTIEKIIEEVISYLGDGAVFLIDAVNQWIDDGIMDGKLGYIDTLNMDFDDNEVIEGNLGIYNQIRPKKLNTDTEPKEEEIAQEVEEEKKSKKKKKTENKLVEGVGVYEVTAYYDNKYRGVESSIETYEMAEAEEFIWDKVQSGHYVELVNTRTGDTKRYSPDKFDENSIGIEDLEESKKVENAEDYNTEEEIKDRLKQINKQLAYIRRRDKVSLALDSEQEQAELYDERNKLNGKLRKIRNKKVDTKNMSPEELEAFKNNLKKLGVWDGTEEDFAGAVQCYRAYYMESKKESKKVEKKTEGYSVVGIKKENGKYIEEILDTFEERDLAEKYKKDFEKDFKEDGYTSLKVYPDEELEDNNEPEEIYEDGDSFTISNGEETYKITKRGNKWVDKDGRRYMGYLTPKDIMYYYKGFKMVESKVVKEGFFDGPEVTEDELKIEDLYIDRSRNLNKVVDRPMSEKDFGTTRKQLTKMFMQGQQNLKGTEWKVDKIRSATEEDMSKYPHIVETKKVNEAKVDGVVTSIPDELLDRTPVPKFSKKDWNIYYNRCKKDYTDVYNGDSSTKLSFLKSKAKSLGLDDLEFSETSWKGDIDAVAMAYANSKEDLYNKVNNIETESKKVETRTHMRLRKGDTFVNDSGAKVTITDVDDKDQTTYKFDNGKGECHQMSNVVNMLNQNGYKKIEEGKRQRLNEENSKSKDLINSMVTARDFDSDSPQGQIILRTQELFNVLSDRGYDVQVTFDNGESQSVILLGNQGGSILITINNTNQPLRAFTSGNFEVTEDTMKVLDDIREQITAL